MFTKIFTSLLMTLIVIGGFFVSVEKQNNNLVVVSYGITVTNAFENALTDGGVAQAPKSTENTKILEMYNKIVAFLNIILGVLTIIVSPAVMLASWLMSPDWTSGDLFGLRGVMYKIWVTISNITYFIYAILLIFIALATIFGRENYAYKAMLPKLALGIILVPFTWWFVQFTISASTYITAHVLTIPHDALESMTAGNEGWWTTKSIPKEIEMTGEKFGKSPVKCSENRGKCMSPKEFTSQSSGIYGSMIIYAYAVFQIQDYGEITTATDQIKAITQIIHQSFIGAIMFLVFGILTLALIFMLLARAVMLWVYTVFSPFLTLELVMGGMMKKVSDDFSIKEFVGLAFVPAIVGLSLSFGLILIAAIQTQQPVDNKSLGMEMKGECTSATIKNPGCTVANIMGNPNNTITRQLKEEDAVGYTTGAGTTYISTNTLKLGGINFIFKGKATGAQEAANQTSSAIGIIGGAGTFFGTIIVDIIALLFIWMAFMAAKGVSKIVNAAAKPFEDMGNSIGKLGASLPKYMPLPVPGVKGGMSLAGLQKTVELGSDKMKYGLEQKTLDEVGKLNPELVKGILKPKDVEELRNSINNIKSRPSKEFLEGSSKAIAQAQSKSEFRNANYETLAQEIKQNRKSNEEIGSFLTSKGISDSHERELLTKFLSGETNGMSEEHKKKAWELHQAKFGTGSSSTNNNTFNVKIAGTDKFTLEGSDFSITSGTSKEDILKLLNKNLPALAKISDDTLKNELKQLGMEEKELDDLIKNVKAERDKTKKDSSSPTTPPSSSGGSTNP